MSVSTKPSLKLFSAEEVERIVGEACRVLESTGVEIEEAEGRKLLDAAGCEVRHGRHLIPERVIRDSLSHAPSSVTLFDREGNESMDLSGNPHPVFAFHENRTIEAREPADNRHVIELSL